MKAHYVTFLNGVKLLIKPTCKIGRMLYCYYWFNNNWFPTVVDYYTIDDIHSVKLHRPTMSIYNDSIEDVLNTKITDKFNDIPNTYRATSNSGSSLFTNTESGIKNMLLKATGGTSNFGTVIAPVFPQINSDWFYTGFPTKLNVGGANGNLVDYIPVYFYATKDGNEKFTLPKLPDRLGYLDQNNVFTETLVWDSAFKKGNLLFTLLLDKNDPACAGSKINDTSYWNLLTEFSNIDPGSSASKAITITSGITQSQGYTMGLSIGSKVAVEAGIEGIAKVSAEFSVQLSASFSTNVSITQQISTTDTVNFLPQPRTQRISTYQFVEQYKIDPADALKAKVDSFNDPNKNYVANFAKAEFQPSPFDYGSRYFAKAFVVEPES